MSIVKTRTVDEDAVLSAKYFPQGKATVNIFNPLSKMYGMIKGYSAEFNNFDNLLNVLFDDFNIYSTENSIDLWEGAVGIPDDCFTNTVSLEARRNQVIAKIKADGVQTAQDFVDIAAILGYEIEVLSSSDTSVFPVSFPWLFLGDINTARNTIVIKFLNAQDPTVFPVPFPWLFGQSDITGVQCFLEKLAPAHVQVVYLFPTS